MRCRVRVRFRGGIRVGFGDREGGGCWVWLFLGFGEFVCVDDHGGDRRQLVDNVYTVCDSEVVAPGCDYAALVGDSTDRSMGSFSAVAARFSFRDYIAKTGLRFRAVGHPLLV